MFELGIFPLKEVSNTEILRNKFTAEQWQADKQQTRLAVPIAYEEYLQERMASLEERLKWLTTNLKDLDGVSLEKGRLSLAR